MTRTPVAPHAPDGQGRRLALAVAQYHPEITSAMRSQAIARAEAAGAHVVIEAEAAGSYDLPLVVQTLLKRPDVDAVVALGAIVTGDTDHDEAIAQALFPALLQLGLHLGKPVGLGVTGPGQTREQARARVDRAAAAVDAVLKTLAALEASRARLHRVS